MNLTNVLGEEFNLKHWQVENTIQLIDEGNTIPFIARYRKEAHGSMDDQTLRDFFDRLEYLRGLEQRKKEVSALIAGQDKMTNEIAIALENAVTLSEVEDIYRPYRPKRKTRASIARDKGLEPLANQILEQSELNATPIEMAEEYVNEEKGIASAKEALSGALDIIAENISDNASIRKRLKVIFMEHGILQVSPKNEDDDSVYNTYYNSIEPIKKIVSHRVLAIDRGEKQGFLKVSLQVDTEKAINIINSVYLKEPSSCSEAIKQAAFDSYSRLIFPSIEREIRNELTDAAVVKSIKVFSLNLKHLLMQPPVKGKVAMGMDPGYRTGCKIAVVDPTGLVLDTDVIYITHSEEKLLAAKTAIEQLIKKHKVEVIAIGNGTASKETEIFTANLIKTIKNDLDYNISYMVVNEAGASVYSASKLAASEFPNFDVTLRSAVSIARRLQDPLAELVKIDPKAIGVGQYQHDMPEKQLDNALKGVVEDCVNTVGVDLNTASASLLSQVSGLSAAVCNNIIAYREAVGAFRERAELKRVPKLGPKAFEQCAGFLRVPESKNILDNTAVHPESYKAAEQLLSICGYTLNDLKENNIGAIKNIIDEIGAEEISEEIGIGVPTLNDIADELLKPGRDPRDELPPPLLRTDVLDIKDLKQDMELQGTVRNVIDFGAFVDIGVHHDGLLHISQICDRYIKHPSQVLKVGDVINVKILDVDVDKKRIALTMR